MMKSHGPGYKAVCELHCPTRAVRELSLPTTIQNSTDQSITQRRDIQKVDLVGEYKRLKDDTTQYLGSNYPHLCFH